MSALLQTGPGDGEVDGAGADLREAGQHMVKAHVGHPRSDVGRRYLLIEADREETESACELKRVMRYRVRSRLEGEVGGTKPGRGCGGTKPGRL